MCEYALPFYSKPQPSSSCNHPVAATIRGSIGDPYVCMRAMPTAHCARLSREAVQHIAYEHASAGAESTGLSLAACAPCLGICSQTRHVVFRLVRAVLSYTHCIRISLVAGVLTAGHAARRLLSDFSVLAPAETRRRSEDHAGAGPRPEPPTGPDASEHAATAVRAVNRKTRPAPHAAPAARTRGGVAGLPVRAFRSHGRMMRGVCRGREIASAAVGGDGARARVRLNGCAVGRSR